MMHFLRLIITFTKDNQGNEADPPNNKDNAFINGNIPNNMTNYEVTFFNSKNNLLILVGYLFFLIASILFVSMFKRKKFKYNKRI